MNWTQVYTPAGSLLLSALIAALPVVILLGLLASTKVSAHVAALAGLAASMAVAIFLYHMPWKLSALAGVFGAVYGLFPIGWIVLCAIFVYDITVQTGQFEIVKRSVAGLADDRRIQAILIAFSFGAFIEGAAGFGTPVAISAAMLIGLGFRPLSAATLALIGNTAPVAFGALGTPILALANVTKIPPTTLSAMVGRQLPFFSLIVPFWLICVMCGWRKMLQVWPACFVAGFSFAVVQFAVSNYHGPWVVDIAAALASIGSVLVLLQFWQPADVWRFEHEQLPADTPDERAREMAVADGTVLRETEAELVEHTRVATIDYRRAPEKPTGAQTFVAWLPWIIVSVVVFAWGVPAVKSHLDLATTKLHIPLDIPIGGLHQMIRRAPPVVPKDTAPERAVFTFNCFSATGTALLICGIISGFVLGLGPAALVKTFIGTVKRVRLSLLTISAMMAIGYTTRYGGLDATLGLAFASTGKLFPFFSPLLGWLGVALTGSDTASNVLFGNLQQITAKSLGFNPILAAASNSSGGVMGKMIDAQSIVVAGVATGQRGGEGQILRRVFFHSIALAILVGLLCLLQSHFSKWWVP